MIHMLNVDLTHESYIAGFFSSISLMGDTKHAYLIFVSFFSSRFGWCFE